MESTGEGLEIGLRIGAGHGAAPPEQVVQDEDPVLRLEGAEPVRARPMSEVGPAVPRESRRKRKRPGLVQWTVSMAVGTCGLAVAAVAGLMASNKDDPKLAETGGSFLVEKEKPLDAGKEYFLEHAGDLVQQAEDLLTSYAEASSVEAVLPLVRDSGRIKEQLSAHWKPWGSDPLFARGTSVQSGIEETGGRPVVVLSGSRGDFAPFRMLFVLDRGELKLDWLASYGIGEHQVSELRAGASVENGMVRAVVRPGRYFTADFPEDRFHSYQLLDAHGAEFIWAFAPRGSAVAEALEGEFNQSSILLEKREEFRAALRVSGPASIGVSSYVVTEMLHKGWVTP